MTDEELLALIDEVQGLRLQFLTRTFTPLTPAHIQPLAVHLQGHPGSPATMLQWMVTHLLRERKDLLDVLLTACRDNLSALKQSKAMIESDLRLLDMSDIFIKKIKGEGEEEESK